MMKFFFLLVLVPVLTGCTVAKKEVDVYPQSFNVTLEVYQNRMPLSDQLAYVAISVVPKETAAKENYRIVSLTASGTEGEWRSETFDFNEFQDKSTPHQNSARNFNLEIGAPYNFTLTIQYVSGSTEVYEVKDVRLQVVH